MKGIILAGGTGTRLYPVTTVVSKQLLPVFDKPMIYYPLSTLMLAGIRDILIISTPQDKHLFQRLLGDGSEIGIRFSYATQETPRGLADAFVVGREFVGRELRRAGSRRQHLLWPRTTRDAVGRSIAPERRNHLRLCRQRARAIWCRGTGAYRSRAVDRGEAEAAEIEFAVTGLYFYDNDVLEIAANVKPSGRGELEITDVNKAYLERGDLFVEVLGRGFAWLDTGTHASLVEASHFVQILEQRQGTRIACPEEIALRQGYISLEAFEMAAQKCAKSGYGEYLMSVARSFRSWHATMGAR